MNTLAYIIYLFITCLITICAGLLFYRNGRIYLLNLLQGDEPLTQFINKMLLTGYTVVMIRFWKTIHNPEEMIISIAAITGRIMLLLAMMHFFNMAVIYLMSKRNNHSLFNHKN
jgi:hypothetical protein